MSRMHASRLKRPSLSAARGPRPYLKYSLHPPETVDEAVDRLLMILDGEHKLAIALMKEDDLFDLHFDLGLAIRNAFGLHEPGSKLLESAGTYHPDDASDVIIGALWQALNS